MANRLLIFAFFALILSSCSSDFFGGSSINGSSGGSSTLVTPTPSPTPPPPPTPLPTPGPFEISSIGSVVKATDGWEPLIADERGHDLLKDSALGAYKYWRQTSDRDMTLIYEFSLDRANKEIYVTNNYKTSRFDVTTGQYIASAGFVKSNIGNCVSQSSEAGWCAGGMFSDLTDRSGIGYQDEYPPSAVDSDNRKLYVADWDRVDRYNLDTGLYEASIGKEQGGFVATTTKQEAPQEFTISTWYKNGTGLGGYILGFQNYQHNYSSSYDRHLYLRTDGQVVFGIYNGSENIIVSTSTIDDGNWHHIVGTYSSNNMRLYINGVEEANLTTGIPAATQYDGYWKMGFKPGNWTGMPTERFQLQSFDNTSIWSKQLTAAEVSAIHTQIIPSANFPHWSDVVGAWTFDQTDTAEFEDISGNENIAFIQGLGRSGGAGKSGFAVDMEPVRLGAGWVQSQNFESTYEDGGFLATGSLAYHDGKIYVGNYNHIARFDATTGLVDGAIGKVTSLKSGSTCLGTGPTNGWCTGATFGESLNAGGFFYAKSVIVDGTNNHMYATDNGARVIKYDLNTGIEIGTIGETSSSSGTCPNPGIATGWCAGGKFQYSFADGGFKQVSSMDVDPINQILYVSDSSAGRISKFNAASGAFIAATGHTLADDNTSVDCPNTGPIDKWCTGASFKKYDSTKLYAGEETYFFNPGRLFFFEDQLLVANSYTSQIIRVDASTGQKMDGIGAKSTQSTSEWTKITETEEIQFGFQPGGFYKPRGIAIDEHFMYIADSGSNRISRHHLDTGAFIGMIGAGFSISASDDCPEPYSSIEPVDEWCIGSGDFYNSNFNDGGFDTPTGLALDSSADVLYVADEGNDRITKHQASTGRFLGAIGNLSSTTDTCPPAGAALEWCKGGRFASGSGNGMFNSPKYLQLDPTNDILYISDSKNHRIVKVQASSGAFISAMGKVTTTGGTCSELGASGWCNGGEFDEGSGDGELNRPLGLQIDLENNLLYVGDAQNGRISKFRLDTGAFIGSLGHLDSKVDAQGNCPSETGVTGWCTGGSFKADDDDDDPTILTASTSGFGLLVDIQRDLMYVPNRDKESINKYQLSSGEYMGTLGLALESGETCAEAGVSNNFCKSSSFDSHWVSGAFNDPMVIVQDNAGNLYVVEEDNHRVTRMVPGSNSE